MAEEYIPAPKPRGGKVGNKGNTRARGNFKNTGGPGPEYWGNHEPREVLPSGRLAPRKPFTEADRAFSQPGEPDIDEPKLLADTVNSQTRTNPEIQQEAFKHLTVAHQHVENLATNVKALDPRGSTMAGVLIDTARQAVVMASKAHESGDLGAADNHLQAIPHILDDVHGELSAKGEVPSHVSNGMVNLEDSIGNYSKWATPAKVTRTSRSAKHQGYLVTMTPEVRAKYDERYARDYAKYQKKKAQRFANQAAESNRFGGDE